MARKLGANQFVPEWRSNMNKVICDVCGTDYPETAAQCPICGCARSDCNQTSAGNTEPGAEERTYTYVKGGRFSKSNVRKRLKAKQAPPVRISEPEYDDDDEDDEDEDEEEGRSNWGLIAIVILLLLAIIAVSSYIAIVHFGLFDQADPTKPSTSQTENTGTVPSTSDTVRVPCTGLTMNDSEITLSAVDSIWQLNFSVEPLDTTDAIKFVSTNEKVATVDSRGRVTAVGSGEATITATCGDYIVECTVICDFDTDVTDPTKPGDTTDPTEPSDPVVTVELKLNREDFTLSKKGATWNVYSGELDPSEITWTSGNEAIVTIENGKVVAVGPGRTRVFAEYEGQKVSCWVSCSFPAEEPTEPTEPSEPADPAEPSEPSDPSEEPKTLYSLKVNGSISPFGDANNAEVSIKVGETFRLTVEDDMAAFQKVEWSMSKDGIVSYDNNKVTGLAKGTVKLTTTYEGQTFICTIYVSEPTPET